MTLPVLGRANKGIYPLDQKLSRAPPNASNGAAGLKNRLSTPGPFVSPLGGIPGAPMPVGFTGKAPPILLC